MKTTIAFTAVLALAGSLVFAPAQAKHHRHHKHAGMTTGMGANGSSGPGLEPGAPDKSRPGGKGVNTKGPQ